MHAHRSPIAPAASATGVPPVAGDLPALLQAVIACMQPADAAQLDAEQHPASAWSGRSVLHSSCTSCHLALQQLQPLLQAQAATLARCQAALQATARELARTRASQWRAEHLSLHDGLTALPNRYFFRQRMARALGDQRMRLAPREQPEVVLAVLVLDLDGFKAINDRHGHAAGDSLLRIVGARLKRAVRGQDMVCRLGGDEFACMLASLPGRPQLAQLAAKLIDTVAAPVAIDKLQVFVRPSVGIALCPTDGGNTDTLLHNADVAMFRAKRERLGYTFFDARCDV